jgi:chitin synthase
MVLVAKVDNPLEVNDVKPGKRGSKIVHMAFLQKVMFDERMTTFEYEFFNSIWRVTGLSPDHIYSSGRLLRPLQLAGTTTQLQSK